MANPAMDATLVFDRIIPPLNANIMKANLLAESREGRKKTDYGFLYREIVSLDEIQ